MGENKNKPVFTPEQKRAIDVRNANILVSASAGAGKTAVLTERIIALVMEKEKPLDVDQIVVVTFTRAAAAEMRSRIASKLNERLVEDPTNHHIQKQLALLPHAQITTIDSFCLSIVRNYFYSIELDPSFRIGDNEEITFIKQGALESVLEEKYQERSESFLTMIEMLAPGKSDAVIEDLILQLHNNSMSHPWPKEWLEECRASFAIGSEEELYSSRWFVESNVMGHVHQIIEESCFKLQEAIARCNPFYDDLEKIIIFLGTEYDMLHSLSNYTKYNQFYLGFDECEFKRFP